MRQSPRQLVCATLSGRHRTALAIDPMTTTFAPKTQHMRHHVGGSLPTCCPRWKNEKG
jgi:hypothetical protein